MGGEKEPAKKMTVKCDYCGAVAASTILKDQTFTYGEFGKEHVELKIIVPLHECLLCGGKWIDKEAAEAARELAIEKYLITGKTEIDIPVNIE